MKKHLIVASALLAPVVATAYFEVRQSPPAPEPARQIPHPAHEIGSAQYNGLSSSSVLPGVGQSAARDEELEVIATRRLSPLRQTGNPGLPSTVEGFGEEIPLDVAIEMVIPPGWAGLAAKGLSPGDHAVSWSPGRSWVDILTEFAVSTGHEIEVDWARQEVVVRPQRGMTALERNQMRSASVDHDELSAMRPVAASLGVAALPTGAAPSGAASVSLEDFLRQPVRIDLRSATPEQVLLAALPPGFAVEPIDVNPMILGRLMDVTTPEGETRGSLLHVIGRDLGLQLTPFPHLGRLLVTEVQR